ncbi:uncharacterized protein [Lolium perenne]|uniref:uncharacterized protein n=1 Tax=Lolium perenne TaxID=4522 RepID=UPI0021F6353F|nr:uncharacterized protein LOC127311559 [Lolium perenne]XP_051197961.1 uncharacterized protein LOC127311559 [Lolium perenne]
MKVTSFLKVLPVAVALGFFMSVYFPIAITPKLQCGILPWSSSFSVNSSFSDSSIVARLWAPFSNTTTSNATSGVARNPQGSERLPPRIVVSESDLHLRRLWGSPTEDTPTRKYLLALAVGYAEKVNVNATVHKFSDNFDVMVFHYDGRTTEWDEFEWSKQATHVSARQQTKWWFAKRFMHPSIVAPYDYIFLWDEDLGVENFSAEPYIDIVKKHGLEISQPGLDVTKGKKQYDITVKRDAGEMHKTDAGGKGCPDVHQRPCSGFVEVMAPVFSRDAWRCVWHMIQNDLIHGWGLDFHFWRCVDDPEEQIGVVDAQYVVHHAVTTLMGKGNKANTGIGAKVKARCTEEYATFRSRISDADKELANSTTTSSSTTLS